MQPKLTELTPEDFNRVVEHKPYLRGDLGFDSYIFHDYAPTVFMELRNLYGVSPEMYLNR